MSHIPRTLKLSRVSGTPEQPTEHPFTYAHSFAPERLPDGTARISAGLAERHVDALRALRQKMRPPYYLLYLLHTSRTGAALGRYQSNELSTKELDDFLLRFAGYLEGDSRHDVWIHSPASRSTLVLDRHNLVFAYGDLSALSSALRDFGVTEVASFAAPQIPIPHAHHYHDEWDDAERAVLTTFDWTRSELRPEDVQFWSGPQA